jgi:proton glutamate symport protein
VDELMDMARTMINLVGNCLATVVMGRWEGEFKPGDELHPVSMAGNAPVPVMARERTGG